MNRISITIFVVFKFALFMAAQNVETFETQAEKIDSTYNPELQIFNQNFNNWVNSLSDESLKLSLNDKMMINDFIIFSEDGLIMKDLGFHSIKSCKERIVASLPTTEMDSESKNWVYISMESQINKSDLIEMLVFLREQQIDYQFGMEDEFVPKLIKNK